MKPVEYQLTGNINFPGVFDAEEVREFAIVVAVVNHKVRGLSRFKRTDRRASIQTVSGIDCRSGDRFSGSHFHVRCRERQDREH